ncbi:sensor histidine kinase [Mesobacillus harenae]|uniref:sensor histidine kinase n=1 Tax=Mesobacillus harenae TaxID=2213203 RepID=UPI0015808C78|nr:HAMP domain-containing sensor histidine kinase [Mesobacillus harenae]
MIVLLSLADIFDKATKQNRIIIACSFSLFISTLVFLIRAILFDHLIGSDFMVVTAFFLIHFLSTFFIVYFYEMLNEALTINKQIIKAEKLEVVCHLASSISHEVRNPLTVVKGFLQMLNEKEFEEDKRKKFIDLSLQEIDRANDIIGSYLTFAKPVQQEPAIIDLKQELDRSITVITPLANMNSVEIQTRIEHCYIKGDPLLLQQCFLNIIKNSIEAMPNGGTLCINTENINGQVLIEITDDGEGMMDEQLRRLGEPFFTTKGREGTGLGMMAVIKIIDMMNGKLDVSSNKKEGTQFRI